MKILIYTYSGHYNKDLALEMIPLGMEPLEACSVEEALGFIEKTEGLQIIITENTDMNFLDQMKAKRSGMSIFMIVHDTMKPQALMQLVKSGITSVLNYTQNVSQMAEEIIRSVIHNNIRTREKRQHVRVAPKSVEVMTGSVFYKEQRKFIRGNIINISAGGLALQFFDTLEAGQLQMGRNYDPVLIAMRGFDIKTVATMVGKRDSIAGFRFDNVEPRDMKRIAEYIHDRLRESGRSYITEIQ